MKFTRNVKAISKLFLILLLLTAAIIGAILSYLWVLGYFITLERVVPEKTAVSIANVTFNPQDTSHFNVTLLNPSYSPSDANITQIVTSTEKGGKEVIHPLMYVEPQLHYKLPRAKSVTFTCGWNWANYTGKTVKIIAFIEDGSGPTFEIKPPLVDLSVTDVRFNSTISVTHFNVTVQNSATSVTYVNITEVSVDKETISAGNISKSLPYSLHPDESVPLQCTFNWTAYQNKSVTVAVYTLQGYVAYYTHQTPKPVNLTITNVLFNITDTTHFNITVQNSEDSPTYVNLTSISVTVENETFPDVPVEPSPDLPYSLYPGANVTFLCSWNWTDYRGKNVTVTVYTLQGFTAQYTKVTPAPIILEIINLIFNPLETNSFNVTVKNSDFSASDANVTEIIVTVNGISETITDVVPSLQGGVTLPSGVNQTFTCSWNWAEYSGKNVTIVVKTPKYSANSSLVLLKALTITNVIFNSLDMDHFVVTVQNPTWLDFTITTMNVTVEGVPLNITGYVVPSLPRMLTPDTNLTFMCEWNWEGDQGKNVTITIETSEGYTTSHTRKIPSA